MTQLDGQNGHAPLYEWIAQNDKLVLVAETIDPVGNKSNTEYGDADRSIYARQPIGAGETLVTLQPGAFLNGSTWLSQLAVNGAADKDGDDTVAALQQEIQSYQPSATVQTAMALLYELGLGEQSRFNGYVQQLPVNISLPMTWTIEEQKLLKHTAAFPIIDAQMVTNVFNTCVDPFVQKFPTLWPKKVVDLEHFHWAYSIVSSRAFTVAGSQEPTLLPVIDMANHDCTNPCAKIEKTDDGSFKLVTVRDIVESEAVTISYGDLSNAQLLCRYGFVLPESVPSDCILITSSELLMTFTAFLNGAGDDSDSEKDEEHTTDDSSRGPSAAKRRKLFAAKSPQSSADNSLFFLLHGNQEQEFGLSDALLSYVFAKNLPTDALYDVLAILLRKKDKYYSNTLEKTSDIRTDSTVDHVDPQVQKLVYQLNKYEREVCRRILLGILTLEESSSEDDDEDEEENEE